MQLAQLIFLSFLLVSCSQKQSNRDDCEVFLPARPIAELNNKKLEEISGLAVSVTNPGHLWVHNDSGNPAAIYLVDEQLKIKLECKLANVRNRDWEDIAVGPGPEAGKSYVYVADIGDNNAKYKVKFIYRFEEPLASDQAGNSTTITEFDTIAFTLEDGKKDTEAIMIHPETNDIYLVSKREKPVYMYKLSSPFSTRDTVVAMKELSLPLTQIVAAGFSPDGEEIVMKNYDFIYYWHVGKQSVKEALSNDPVILCYSEEPQGESIAFNLDGSGLYTLSEKIKGERIFLNFYPRKNP